MEKSQARKTQRPSNNSYFGQAAGNTNKTGSRNSFFGKEAGFSLVTSFDNSFFGHTAGMGITVGNNNSMFGSGAGGSANGANNAYFGSNSGGLTDGSNNSFFGSGAGITINGSDNICIGNGSGPTNVSSVSNRLYIDVTFTDDPLIYGEFDNDFVKINGTFEVTGGLSNQSDVNLKENIGSINTSAILDKVASLNISEWNFKEHPGHRHIGAMAQDFHRAFGLGADEKHISTIDADGIALAAIQALKQENDALKMIINDLLDRVETIESK